MVTLDGNSDVQYEIIYENILEYYENVFYVGLDNRQKI